MEGPLNFLGIIGWVRQCVPQCMPPLTHRLIGVTYRSEVCKIVSFVLNWRSWAATELSSRLHKSQNSRIGNSYSDKYLCGTVQTLFGYIMIMVQGTLLDVEIWQRLQNFSPYFYKVRLTQT